MKTVQIFLCRRYCTNPIVVMQMRAYCSVVHQSDVALLPIKHTSAEELAIYLWGELIWLGFILLFDAMHIYVMSLSLLLRHHSRLGSDVLCGRGISNVEVSVFENPHQSASFVANVCLRAP